MSIADLLLLLLIATDIVAIMSTLNCCCFFRFVAFIFFISNRFLFIAWVGRGATPGGSEQGGAGRVGAADFGGITWFSRVTEEDQ